LPGCGGVRWGRTSITLPPLCTTKDMPQVVSSVFCVPLRSWLNGCKDMAMPSARWMKTFYERISLGSRDTVAGTGPKQPRGLATSSDSSANTASHVPGKTGFPLHLSISGYAPMMPILSTRHRDRQNRQPSARRAARERPRGPHDLQRSFATRSKLTTPGILQLFCR